MSTEFNDQELRRRKYTPAYYINLKKDKGLKWKEVEFVCIECGDIFHKNAVKPRTLPVNCSEGCRMDAFDGKSIGGTIPPRVRAIKWPEVRTMINGGRSGPEISKKLNIALTTLHKYAKKKLGTPFLKKLIENGKKRRKQGQESYYTTRTN